MGGVYSFTWPNGLIAENGDILTIVKWNELLQYINSRTGSATSTDRDDNDISLTRYYGTEYEDGTWKIDRENGTGTGFVRDTATDVNNSGQASYTSAWSNRITLNY